MFVCIRFYAYENTQFCIYKKGSSKALREIYVIIITPNRVLTDAYVKCKYENLWLECRIYVNRRPTFV